MLISFLLLTSKVCLRLVVLQLLVNQQIISLDLSVAEVYEKLWRKDHPDQPMIIIYRMRGLLGDATEPFVQSLADTSSMLSMVSMFIFVLSGGMWLYSHLKFRLLASRARLTRVEFYTEISVSTEASVF